MDTPLAIEALQALANASWLDMDPSDTEELAAAKSQARAALAVYHELKRSSLLDEQP